VSQAERRPRWPGADLPGRRLFYAVPIPPTATGQIAGGANMILFTTGRGSMFGAKPVPAITILYPIDFLPAA